MKAPTANLTNQLRGRGPAVLWAVIVGGFLWIIHGYFRFMTPQGPDAVWREELGYSPILSKELFVLYNLPGVLALLLTSWAVLSYMPTFHNSRTALRRAAQLLVLLASLLGLMATVGLAALFVPPATGGISMGVPVLGLALFLAGLSVARSSNGQEGHRRFLGPALVVLGVIGMVTLPVQPLMYALALLPLAFGAALFALFGAGWIFLGFSLRTEPVKDAGTAYARQSRRKSQSA